MNDMTDDDQLDEERKVTYVLYQSVELDIDFKDESINGIATLWLGLREKDSIKDRKEDDKVLETISLHCRNCNISSITINGTSVQYVHNDPLKSLNLDDPTTYQSEEGDVRFRAALEISRAGELRISLPDVVPMDTKPLQALPANAPNEVIQRFKKLNSAYETLKPKSVSKWLGDDVEITEQAAYEQMEHTTSGRLLQVCIHYKVDKQPTGLTPGFIFRKPYTHIDVHRGQHMIGSKDVPVCLYTTGGSPGLLRDLDGSRCWMPCIDSPDQRAVFDVTIKAPTKYEVVCSGLVVSKTTSPDLKTTSHRFVTITRIPAMSIGFFIGKVETYTMPLYKTDGRFMVARGLQDFMFSTPRTNKLNRKISSLLINNKDDVINESKDNVNDDEMKVNNDNRHRKRQRYDERNYQYNEEKNRDEADDDEEEAMDEAFTDKVSSSLLYVEEVRHTTLGLDLGMRIIHRLVGRKYDQQVYSQIFVPGLTTNVGKGICGHSLSFDGFSLVDGSILHTNEHVYMEMPAHVQQITAYLYSWLKSGLPIDSYNSEFIVHGVVGYLTNIYIDHIFGEDLGQYRFQKLMDFIVEYEKMGKGKQLVSFHPESYECLSPEFRQYNYYKSTLLMCLIEHRIGGKDTMTMALADIIKSPPLVHRRRQEIRKTPIISPRPRAGSITGRARAGSMTSDNGDGAHQVSRDQYYNNEMSPDPFSDMSPSSFQMSPSSYGEMSPYGGVMSPNPYGGNAYGGSMMSPNPYGSMMSPTYGGMMSPNPYNNPSMSPNPYGGMMSPNPYGGGNYYVYQGNTGYGSTQQAASTDLFALSCDCISTENFVALIHRVGGSEADISLASLDRYLFERAAIFARMYLTNETRTEKKSITVTVESLNSKYESRSRLSHKDELFLRVIEMKDDLATDTMFALGAKEEYNYRQQLHLKVGRKLGTKLIRIDEPIEEQELLREQDQITLKTALQLARSCDLPVRAMYLDPQFHQAAEIHVIGPDCLLVEQLFAMNDNKDVLRQIQAIRSLSRAHSLAKNKNGSLEVGDGPSGKYPILQLKALYECLLGTTQQATGLNDKNVMSRPHCPSVRAEAAFGLARWQNERAPLTTAAIDPLAASFQKQGSIQEVDTFMQSGPWQGLSHLISALQIIYMVEDPSVSDGNLFVPWTIDAAREDDAYLRNSMLLALSSIRAQNDVTPKIVVDIILLFAEYSIMSSVTSTTDETYYKAILLLCLSRIRFEVLTTGQFNPSDSKTISRITNLVHNCLLSDLAFSRTKARISQKNDSPNMMPLLVADGLLVAATLTCSMEIDVMIIQKLYRTKIKIGEEWRFLMVSFYEKDGIIGPLSIGEETKIDYVRYFLPVNCKLSLTRNADDESTTCKSGKFINASSSNCPPLMRQAALEAFVRICFLTHYLCSDRLNKRFKSPNNLAKADPKLVYIAAAIEAVIAVIQHDPCRGTRYAAAMTLLDALQDRPSSRSLSSGLSMGEPLCQSFIDPLASTLPSSCTFHNTNGSLKTSNSKGYTSAINIMVLKNDPTILTQLKRLWDVIYNYSTDQGIRSILLSCWLYMFPNEVLINEEPIDYSTIDPFFDGSLPQDRLNIDDPFEVTQKMEMKLRHGGAYKDLKLQEQQQGISNNTTTTTTTTTSSSSSNLKLSISLKKSVSPCPTNTNATTTTSTTSSSNPTTTRPLNVKLNLSSSSSSSSSSIAPVPVSTISASSPGIALSAAKITTTTTPVKPVLKFKFK